MRSKLLISQSCLTLYEPLDYSPPSSSVNGISRARFLEWVSISFSRGSSCPRDQTWLSAFTRRFFTDWATRKAQSDSVRMWSSVQFRSHSVMSDSLRPHEPQHARPPCPSPTPRVHPNSCPLYRWCHPTVSSSVVPFSCPQSFPASGSFRMSQPFASGGQSIGVSASTSVLPMNTQDWSPLGRTGWISLQSKGLSRVFSNTIVQKHQFVGAQLSLESNSHIHTWPLEKP